VPDIGCVTPEPSTNSLVDVTVRLDGSLVSMLDNELLPVVCSADVDAPVGSDTVPDMLVTFQVPL
jgi:hypothetical protein